MCFGWIDGCMSCAVCSVTNFCSCVRPCTDVVLALLMSTHIWIWAVVSAIVTNVFFFQSHANLQRGDTALLLGSMLFTWYVPYAVYAWLGKFGARVTYLAGALLMCGALASGASDTTPASVIIFIGGVVGIGVGLLGASVELLVCSQHSEVSLFLEFSEFTSAIIGVLIGSICTYYLGEAAGTRVALQILGPVSFVALMIVLAIVHAHDPTMIKDRSAMPRDRGLVSTFAINSFLCGACSWVVMVSTVLVARIDHDMTLRQTMIQFMLAAVAYNLMLIVISAAAIPAKRIAPVFTAVGAIVLIGCIVWFVNAPNVDNHWVASCFGGAASACMGVVRLNIVGFFDERSADFARSVGDFAYGTGAFLAIASMAYTETNNTYLEGMILPVGLAALSSIYLVARQPSVDTTIHYPSSNFGRLGLMLEDAEA